MNHERQLREGIEQLAGTHLKDKVLFVDCNVNSIDMEAGTCSATPIGGDAPVQITGINLESDVADGLLIIPVINSTITVFYSKRNLPYIIKYSDIDTIYYSGNLWQFGDGSFGGLTKTQELKKQLDMVNAQLQAVISSLKNWIPVPNDGGTALQTYFNLQIAGKDPGDFSNIENPNVTHGE